MARRIDPAMLRAIDPRMLSILDSPTDTPESIEERVRLLQSLRASMHDGGLQLDRFLIERHACMHKGIQEAIANQKGLKELMEKLTAPPGFPAVVLRTVQTATGLQIMVSSGSSRRLVAIGDGVDAATLKVGDEVLLNNEQNIALGKLPPATWHCGETARVERYTADRRLILRSRDEEVVVQLAEGLALAELKNGDQVRWDRNALVAFEKIERAAGQRFLLGDTPNASLDQVGGQDTARRLLLAALTTTLIAPEKATLYGLDGRVAILMVGPPGCGKTLLVRVVAAELQRISGKRCRIAVVKPAEWESPYVGETQDNIRNLFKTLREEAEQSLVILFLDEVESVGRIRGSFVGHHSDKFLAALLAELDGFTDRAGVAVIAATNAKELIDPALLERLSDLEIQVNRPDMRGAQAIFQIHLPASLPFSPNGSVAMDTRREIIDLAVSRFYSPNADNELSVLRFRDGKARSVAARELASGRVFQQVCRTVRQEAFLRDVRDGEPGLRIEDMQTALAQTMDRLATTLTVRNVRSYLADLPQDIDVVSVEPIRRRVKQPHCYINRS
jgi:proteasome-associated ATPase